MKALMVSQRVEVYLLSCKVRQLASLRSRGTTQNFACHRHPVMWVHVSAQKPGDTCRL